MLASGPPNHTRLRKLVAKAFTARSVERMSRRIEEIADELLDAVDTSAPVDLIKAYAGPLPARVIGDLLGVPEGFRDQFLTFLVPYLNQSTGPEMAAASAGLTTMLTDLLADKRRLPCDDLMTALIEASSDGDRLSATELLAAAYLLIVAGFDTTANLIGNGIPALLSNPSQLAALRADTSLLPSAVEELLRITSPVNISVFRFATEPIRVGDPGGLDIARKPGHLAFGFAHLELATTEPLAYRDGVMIHGLVALPVHCHREA